MAAFTRRFVVGLAATVALGSVSLGLSARDEPAAIPYAVPAAIPPADAVVPVHAIEPVRPEAAVSLEWSGPPVVRLNRPNDYTLTVRNVSSQAVQRVTVQVRATPGATVVADKPAAADGVLLWELPALDAKQSKDFKLRVTPTRCGEAGCQAWVTLTGTAAMKMKVQEPKLTVSVEAPAKVAVGDAVEVKVFARNAGDCAAENVTVILRTPSGDVPVFKAAALDAGRSFGDVQFKHTFVATAAGPIAFTAVATGTDCQSATANAATTVLAPQLKLTLTGPKELLVGRTGKYTARVENTGEIPVKAVRLRRVVPAGWTAASAPTDGRPLADELAPGQARETTFDATPTVTGRAGWFAEATGDRNAKAAAECVTVVDGIAALRMELIDTIDPVEKGHETVYEVRVTNTGTKADTNVIVACPIPAQMKFVRADGPTGHTATALNNCTVVKFDPVRELAPKTEAVFRIVVKAAATGDIRFKATMNSDALSTSVAKEESTRVYGD